MESEKISMGTAEKAKVIKQIMTPYLTSSAKFNSKQTTDLNGKGKL